MGKLRQLSPELWPLIDFILFSYNIELIFRGWVSCLPAVLLFFLTFYDFRMARSQFAGDVSGQGEMQKQV